LFRRLLLGYTIAIMRRKGVNICGYWECDRHIRDNHFLCAEHYEDWEYGLIDQCPSCGRFKDAMYELCLDCYYQRPVASWKPSTVIPTLNRHYGVEHSDAWTKGDEGVNRFFVYILKLDSGDFYIGHTRELRERLSEHRDKKTSSTAGRNPKLQYFEVLPNREAAELREADLKKLKDSNPRQIRRMIISFQDLIREVKLD